MFKIGCTSLIVLMFVILGMTWIVQGNNFFLYKVFGIEYANVNRQIFEQGYSYNRAMANDLVDLKRQYDSTEDIKVKAAITSAVNAKVAGYDLSQLHDIDLANWVRGLR